jgi:hypothetical protein
MDYGDPLMNGGAVYVPELSAAGMLFRRRERPAGTVPAPITYRAAAVGRTPDLPMRPRAAHVYEPPAPLYSQTSAAAARATSSGYDRHEDRPWADVGTPGYGSHGGYAPSPGGYQYQYPGHAATHDGMRWAVPASDPVAHFSGRREGFTGQNGGIVSSPMGYPDFAARQAALGPRPHDGVFENPEQARLLSANQDRANQKNAQWTAQQTTQHFSVGDSLNAAVSTIVTNAATAVSVAIFILLIVLAVCAAFHLTRYFTGALVTGGSPFSLPDDTAAVGGDDAVGGDEAEPEEKTGAADFASYLVS